MAGQKKGIIISVGRGEKKQVVERSLVKVKVQGQSVSPKVGRAIDLVFVIDTTGSMSDKIEGLLATCQRFVDEFSALNLGHRIAVVAFGDLTVPGDDIRVIDFAESVESVKDSLRRMPRYGGGGNSGESSLEAVERAMLLQFRPSAVKVLLLITDEPALQQTFSADEMIRRLAKAEVLAFVVSPPEPYYKEMARQTGGSWYQVSANVDFTELLAMFRNVAAKVSEVVSEVFQFGAGSVRNYLQLKAPEK